MKIVLITTGQPSSNPRLVKEANALAEKGYEVMVLYCFWADWAQKNDEALLSNVGWKYLQVGGAPGKSDLVWKKTRLRRKLFSYLPFCMAARVRAISRAYDELLKAAIIENADLYIAHNLGALPVAAKAAKRNRSKFAFDAEDYHRGEVQKISKNVEIIENRYFSNASYVSAASPQIREAYLKHYPDFVIHSINNVFSKKQQPEFKSIDINQRLSLFWFSQTLGLNRGLHDVLIAISTIEDFNIRLTILSKSDSLTRQRLMAFLSNKKHIINFIDPIPEKEIPILSSHFHIGLALEPGFSINNNIALSNKIFTYLLAGNAIIASETDAQRDFMHRYPQVGKSYPIGDIRALADILRYYHTHRDELEQTRRNAWNLAHTELNWEKEQEKFLELVENALKQA